MSKKNYKPDNRTNWIHVRMSDEEYEQFQLQLERTGMTMSDYIRDMTLTGEVKVIVKTVLNSDKLDQIIYECGCIGNNVNQIAKHLNEGNPMTAKLTKQLHHELASLATVRAQIEKLEEGM